MNLDALINENIKLINTINGRTITCGTLEKIELNSVNLQIILFYNNKRKYVFKNVQIQYIIL